MNPPPVGYCPHKNITPTPMQHPSYRLDDSGLWIYYHGYHERQVRSDSLIGALSVFCGLPERWRYRQYLRYCGECNRKFSNPWVPVCSNCWSDPTPYPSWQNVVAADRAYRLGGK